MPKKIVAWVLKGEQKQMQRLYPHWKMDFVDSAKLLVEKSFDVDMVVVSLTKVRTYKTVETLKQIKKIYYIDVSGYVTNPMFEAQKNTEFWFPGGVEILEDMYNNTSLPPLS